MDDQDLNTAHVRRKPGPALWLSAAGVAVLALGIAIGSTFDAEPATTAAPALPTTSPQATTSTTESVAAARPGTIWLSDLPPVDSSSIDDMYVESPWTAAPAKVRKVTYPKSVSATGAWCSSAQLTFALDGKYDRFTAQVAIADDSLATKELDFYVLVDDHRAAEIANTGPTPQPVDLPVTGARLLTIGVEPLAEDPSDCPGPERVGVWADPTLTPAG
ncbi:NPCBM/NEW2 domain-containing protein [Saccharothrix luteola]|uniref:NPCBM/NEW2 domain-containing protein n=1 Tax=Saccharothrix luteola TaxID=2893018 RepID=UPI001E2CAB5F|nr:NPCBM/NEW2 domain-containing protein [Saccharothrix luteola]MCC8244171.1 NPCBM/NEW2 domain-containing protein [Saccharothrix luteola]MCC8250893.1 NPCBM/NEW2 domain-containing protein [Saccharothrix luteola]